MKKILYLNYIPSPYRIDFFNELNRYVDLTVIYYHKSISERKQWVYNSSDHNYKHDFLFKTESQLRSNGYFKLIGYLNNSYDVIVVGGYAHLVEIFAISYLKFTKKPFILNTDGGFYQGNKLKLVLKRYLIKAATLYLSSGKLAAATLERYGAPKERIFNYHFTSIYKNEVLNEKIAGEVKDRIRQSVGIPEDAFVILTVGRFIPLKGFELVIKAIKHLQRSDLFLVMLGDGPSYNLYNDLIKKLKLEKQVCLPGNKPKEVVLEFCKISDVMVLPTLTSDVWGLVVNEAMSCGLPVIASDRVGAAYDMIINGETGYRIPAGSFEAIADSIKNTEKNKESLTGNVLAVAGSYTIEQMVEDHLAVFNKILNL